MAHHTYLMRPGAWRAAGLYWDERGVEITAEGASEMIHRPEVWELAGALRLLGPEPVTFTNTYRIEPLPAGGRTTRFESHNPALGRITGRFTLIGDAILVTATSADGLHTSTECLTRIDDDRYRVRGVFARGEAVAGTWAMELTAGAAREEP